MAMLIETGCKQGLKFNGLILNVMVSDMMDSPDVKCNLTMSFYTELLILFTCKTSAKMQQVWRYLSYNQGIYTTYSESMQINLCTIASM